MRTKPCLTHDDVQRIASAAREAAVAEKLAVSIAIVDDGGHLLSFERLDARPSTITVATGKARTSALMRGPSGALESRIPNQPALLALDAMPLQGGLPLMVDGDCVGAIGVSGGTGEQDERVASAGCRSL